MKKYKPEALVAVSRYQKYFPTLSEEVQRDVYAMMRKLLEQENVGATRATIDTSRRS